jgi:hypothetical protein
MINLWFDLEVAMQAGLTLLHLTAEPISVAEVAAGGFGMPLEQHRPGAPASYDFRSIHAQLFGGCGHYQYSKRDTVQAVRAYAQSEPGP